MYNNNDLYKMSKSLTKYSALELDSPYKTELFRGHLNGAKENLNRAAQLLGRKTLPVHRSWIPSGEMVALFISVGIICVFWIFGI